MLVRLGAARRALNIPLLMLAIAVGGVLGASASLATLGLTLKSGGLTLFVLVLVAVVLTQLRSIRAGAGQLEVGTIFGSESMDLDAAALGVRVHHRAKGGSTYTVYAFDGDKEIELAEAGSQAGGERLRGRLGALLFSAGAARQSAGPSEAATAARTEVERREQQSRTQQQQAQQVVDQYYASSKARYLPWIILGCVFLYGVGTMIYMYVTGVNL